MSAHLDLFAAVQPVEPVKVTRSHRAYWVRLMREAPVTDEARTAPRIRAPEHVARLIGDRMASEPAEVMVAILLDSQSRVIAIHEVSRGLLNCSLVHPREVFRAAILAGAAGVIVAHNHPSGDPTPSPEDRAVTQQLVAAGELLDIPVYDHVIIGTPTAWTSFATAGLL